jgi:hypothetical protein
VPNDGGATSLASGEAIVAHFPTDSLRVIPGGGPTTLVDAELDAASG